MGWIDGREAWIVRDAREVNTSSRTKLILRWQDARCPNYAKAIDFSQIGRHWGSASPSAPRPSSSRTRSAAFSGTRGGEEVNDDPLHFTTAKHSAVMIVTPEIAANWLQYNTGNRNLSTQSVDKFARLLTEGTSGTTEMRFDSAQTAACWMLNTAYMGASSRASRSSP